MSVEIIDPEGGFGDRPFASAQSSGGLPFEQPRSEPYEPRYEDIPEVRPVMEQRLSGLSLNETRKRSLSRKRSRSRPRRPSTGLRDQYVYWRLEKVESDWGTAYRRKIPAPQKEIERMARKGSGAVLAETRRMGSLRASHLERLIDDANADEKGDYRWEPVYIDSVKLRGKSGKIECKSMDVILARILPAPKPLLKNRKGSGELVDIINDKPKDKGDKGDKKDKKDKKEKKDDKDGKEKDSKSKDDLNLDDPFDDAPLFHKTGKPMDSQGPMEFKNAGLPEHIPPDRPIGAGARDEVEKVDKKDKKKKKRRKSRDRNSNPDGVIDVGDMVDSAIPAGILDDVLAGHPLDVGDGPVAEAGRRSRSRKRSKSARRRQSRARAESISFPPGYRPAYSDRGGGGRYDDSTDSDSDSSHYGIGLEEHSSRTSNDTYDSIGRRGSHYEDGGGRQRVYKEHYRGPRRERPTRPHYESGGGYYYREDPPRRRQIAYRDYDVDRGRGELVRARVPADDYERPSYYRQERRSGGGGGRERPVLHYPHEYHGRRAERYMDESVIDEELDRREDEIRRREAHMDHVEEEEEYHRRRLAAEEADRLREYGGRRRYHDDDGYRRERDRSRGYSDGRYDPRYDRDYRRGDFE